MVKSKKRFFLILGGIILFILLLATSYLFIYDPAYKESVQSNRDKPLVFAHRGFGTLGPDNSLAGSIEAVKSGVDGVDVDGQLTKDGKIVIFHDLSVDRLTDAEGKVSNKTLTELTSLDLAPGYKPVSPDQQYKYDTAPVKSFEDFVANISPDAILMVELKVSAKGDTGIEREAYRIIQKYDAFDNVYLSSFNPLVIKRLESLDRRINTVYIFMDTNWNAELLAEMDPKDKVDLPWFLQKEWSRRGIRKYIQPDMLSVNKDVSEETRKYLIDQRWPVLLWATNTTEEINNALDQKPYGIISDEPLQVLKAVQTR